MKEDIKRSVEHMLETNDVRKTFWHMDEKVKDLLYGIRQGDDAVVVGDIVVNMEGPYPLKTGRKTGLIHTCSDIVVMGGRPLFGLDAMQVTNIQEAKEVAEDLKKQSLGLGVPIVGGNTQMENDLNPCVSFAVFGRLIGDPIPDAGMRAGDRVLMLGEVVEGEIGERVHRAKTKFNTFMALLENGVDVHAAKDASRGGWFGNLTEMLVKSRKGMTITSIPYPRISRYMGTYLISVQKKEIKKIVEIAARHHCPVVEVGSVTKDAEITIGDEVAVDSEKMQEMIRRFPYRKANVRGTKNE
jgi:selenophosphate synthetase-related protein